MRFTANYGSAGTVAGGFKLGEVFRHINGREFLEPDFSFLRLGSKLFHRKQSLSVSSISTGQLTTATSLSPPTSERPLSLLPDSTPGTCQPHYPQLIPRQTNSNQPHESCQPVANHTRCSSISPHSSFLGITNLSTKSLSSLTRIGNSNKSTNNQSPAMEDEPENYQTFFQPSTPSMKGQYISKNTANLTPTPVTPSTPLKKPEFQTKYARQLFWGTADHRSYTTHEDDDEELAPTSSGSDLDAELRRHGVTSATVASRNSTSSLGRAIGNPNINPTDGSHEGSSEQSHKSACLPRHPLSQSRSSALSAAPRADSPTYQPFPPSSHTPAFNSTLNSRARQSTTFHSSICRKVNGLKVGMNLLKPSRISVDEANCLASPEESSKYSGSEYMNAAGSNNTARSQRPPSVMSSRAQSDLKDFLPQIPPINGNPSLPGLPLRNPHHAGTQSHQPLAKHPSTAGQPSGPSYSPDGLQHAKNMPLVAHNASDPEPTLEVAHSAEVSPAPPPISLARRRSIIIHESSNDLCRQIAREVNGNRPGLAQRAYSETQGSSSVTPPSSQAHPSTASHAIINLSRNSVQQQHSACESDYKHPPNHNTQQADRYHQKPQHYPQPQKSYESENLGWGVKWAILVGDVKTYDRAARGIIARRSQPFVLDQTRLEGHPVFSQRRGMIYIGKDVDLAPESKIGNSTCLGPSCTISHRAEIRQSCIGSTTLVGDRSQIEDSYIFDHVSIGSNARIKNSIVGCSEVSMSVSPDLADHANQRDLVRLEYLLTLKLSDFGSPNSSSTSLSSLSSNASSSRLANIQNIESIGEVGSTQDFVVECVNSLERAFEEDHTVENATIELKTLRTASNVPQSQVRKIVFARVLKLVQNNLSKLTKWIKLIRNMMNTPSTAASANNRRSEEEEEEEINEMVKILIDLQSFCCLVKNFTNLQTQESVKFLSKCFQAFYNLEIISEDSLLKWFKSQQSKSPTLPLNTSGDEKQDDHQKNQYLKLREVGGKLLQMLMEADSESSEDED
ncbi:hypothetical protein MJO29_014661 [Puccinia striiformis f. sp. tritici]|nr:hypothetical protein MJO29_014661 [Puccinia striiformis f. sp. tritici]